MQKVNIFFVCIYLSMRNFKNDDDLHIDNMRPREENGSACRRNMLAVSVANVLYDGKSKEEIKQITAFLHVLIALAKNYET